MIIGIVVALLAGGGVLTYTLVSGDDTDNQSAATSSTTPGPGEVTTSGEPSPSPTPPPSATVVPPTMSLPTEVFPTDQPGGAPSPQAYIDVAVLYAQAVRNHDCAAARRFASEILVSNGEAIYCGDAYTRGVMADFDPSHPEVQTMDVIQSAQVTFTWGSKTALLSLSAASGTPKVDVLLAY